MNSIIRVIIADDFEIIRHGIKRVLDFEENISVVSEASDGREIIGLLNLFKPDVLLLDMSMPGFTGIEILKQIRNQNIKVKVIMLTVEKSSSLINSAIEFGADGYVLKESTTNEIVEAITFVMKGEKYLDKSLMKLMFDLYKTKTEEGVFSELTKRELEILYYLSKGLSNKNIALELFLSEKTIKNNLTKIYRKIDVNDRVHAVIIAITGEIHKYYSKD